MPIYMDRHDVSETVTAEHIARIHQEDLKVQHQFGCRGLTYWFDGKRLTAFCLIEAPDVEALLKMHNAAHGDIPNQVIEVDPNIVESFLGRIEDPRNTGSGQLNIISDPGFRIIMVVSLQQESSLGNGPSSIISSLQEHNRGLAAILNRHDGKTVRKEENYFLVSFRSASGAVKAAIDIRSAFEEFRKKTRVRNIRLKVGLCTGEPVTEKKIIFADAVKLAE